MSVLYNLAQARAERGVVHFMGNRLNSAGGVAPCGTSSDKKGIAVTTDPMKVTCLRCYRWLT